MGETLQQRVAALSPFFELHRPEGEGPFPVVVQLHGCRGKKPFQTEWARVAVAAGWAALIVDSFAHRGIGRLTAYASVCTGMRLRGAERAGDLFAALAWLREQPWVRKDRIVAVGWSHGAWAVLDACCAIETQASATGLAALPAEPLAGMCGAFVFYPYVGLASAARRSGLRASFPVTALVGSQDTIVGALSAKRALLGMKTGGAPIHVEWLEGATHAFDESTAKDLRVRYDPKLTARAQRLFTDFLNARAA